MNILPRVGGSASLSKQAIRDKVEDYAIFSYYIGRSIPLRRAFRSPLHEDRKPSFWVIQVNGVLLFRDFTLNVGGDCFKFVMTLYNEDLYEALKRINRDFQLDLSEKGDISDKRFIYEKPEIEDFEYAKINYKPRQWTSLDKEYWQQYRITLPTLIKHCVVPISRFWIDSRIYQADPIAYAYNISGATKIYQPYSDFLKWRSNQNQNHIFGIETVDPYSEVLIFTKSNKDLMAINECDLESLAPAAEGSLPSEEFFLGLRRRHKHVFLLWDNDFDKKVNYGKKNAMKIISTYPWLINIFIPDRYLSKDFSDLIKNIGFNYAKLWLTDEINTQLFKLNNNEH